MDIDAFIAVHQEDWDRLRELTRRRHLDAAQIDELLRLYQATATHLSRVRSTNPDPVLTARLSLLVHRARLRITGARVPLWRHARTFFWEDFPAALYQARWAVVIAAAIFLLPALISGFWFAADPAARATMATEAEQRAYAGHLFEDYYMQGEASGFAAQVWSNNAWITVQVVIFGVTGVWPVWVLLQNGFHLGFAGAVMSAYDRLDTFFLLILPHGLLELTCVIVGAGAGLRTFWAWVRPGQLPRLWALARAARALATVAIGLIPVLLVAGVVEAFVTPSPLPDVMRIGIGVAAWLAFLAFMLLRGRAVYRRGISGDLSEALVGDRVASVG